jgi:hypothetical protein
MGAALLVPVVVTFNLQQRWLLLPYLVVLLAVAWFVHLARGSGLTSTGRMFLTLLLATFVALSAFMNFRYREGFDRLFFRGWQMSATSTLAVLAPAYDDAEAWHAPIYAIDSSLPPTYGDSLYPLVGANTDYKVEPIRVIGSPTEVRFGGPRPVVLQVDPVSGAITRALPLLQSGEIYEDGFVGKEFKVSVLDPNCRSLSVRLTPVPPGTNNSVAVQTNYGANRREALPPAGKNLKFRLAGPAPRLVFRFGRAVAPSGIGAGQDIRSLAAKISLGCEASR